MLPRAPWLPAVTVTRAVLPRAPQLPAVTVTGTVLSRAPRLPTVTVTVFHHLSVLGCGGDRGAGTGPSKGPAAHRRDSHVACEDTVRFVSSKCNTFSISSPLSHPPNLPQFINFEKK